MSAPTSAPLVRWNGKEHLSFKRELPFPVFAQGIGAVSFFAVGKKDTSG
jgi:hypothetical protein